MIGLPEIIFSVIIFCVLWFIIFKFKLIYDEKSKLRNINARLEKQDFKAPELLADMKGHNELISKQIEEKERIEREKKENKPKKKLFNFKFLKKAGDKLK